ncbi:hypothetical protein ACFYWU_34660 [Streptomyces chrestomyceticus]|uniref:hypothetical protein n=1 Tax=Streptomyces chrestomyceticus TaxID=68185 RepID=UPI003698E631
MLASKTPDGVCRQIRAHLLVHRALRELMPETAAARRLNPDRISFTETLRSARRRGGFPDLVDILREVHVPPAWPDAGTFLREAVDQFGLDRTQGQPCAFYLAAEKDTLRTLMTGWVAELGIPVLVVRGFGSQSYVDVVRARAARDERKHRLLFVGDCDASGEDIERDFVARTGCWSTVERVALTYEQVLAYGLPPAEGKRGDPRWPAFARRHGLDAARPVQWEVEALDPDELQRLVLAAVAPHVDRMVLARQIAREEEQRRALRRFARSWPDGSRAPAEPAEGAAADEPTVTSPVVHDPAAVERFWTAELMREAGPLPMPDDDEDDEASGPEA